MREKIRVLVTGGAGFIGSNIAKEIERRFERSKVYVLDNFSSGNFKNLLSFKGEVITGDIRDARLWEWMIKEYEFDVIFHNAAITDTTVTDQKLMMENNADSFRHVLRSALFWKAKVIYASSAGVYGNTPPPMREDGQLKPENIYGFSKLIMDRIALSFLEKHNEIKVIGFRYFNVYGEGESFKGKSASMIYQIYTKISSKEKPRLFKWGEQKRDFVYIRDVVKANMLALEKDVSGIFNIGTGESRSFNEIVDILSKELGVKTQVEYFDCPYDFYQNHTEADISKAKQVLGYSPEFSLEEGIRDYLRSLQS
mgnify:CR=1 FL=1